MARQTFTEGQRVYIKRYGNTYIEAEVSKPDVAQTAYGQSGRKVHYVHVHYVRDGKLDDNEWPVLNNRQMILTADAHEEIKRNKIIASLRATIARHSNFEQDFANFVDEAERIIDEFARSKKPDRLVSLALHLRGKYVKRGQWRASSAEMIAGERADKRTAALAALVTLQDMGEKVQELP